MSSIDWCEENYVYTQYIAEFFNTISSTSMIITGIILINKSKQPSLDIINYLIILVGIGSVLFHACLSKYTQALDEVPMIWTCLAIIYLSFKQIYNSYNTILKFLITIYGVCSSLLIVLPNGNTQFKLFHALNTFITFISIIILYKLSVQKKCIDLFYNASNHFGIGLCLWILDLFFCDYVQPFNLHAFWHLFSSIGVYNAVKVLHY